MQPTEGIGQAKDYFLGAERDSCWHCGQLTYWISLSFQAHLHPVGCGPSKWEEYAYNAGGRDFNTLLDDLMLTGERIPDPRKD